MHLPEKEQTNSTLQDNRNPSPSNSLENRALRQPGAKPITSWEEPDFDEFDLCMEVTAYINHWQ